MHAFWDVLVLQMAEEVWGAHWLGEFGVGV